MPGTVTTNPPVSLPLKRWLHSHRPRRIVYWLLILWTLNLFDVAFTLTAAETGLFGEANPAVRPWVEASQFWNIFAYKMMFLLLATWIFMRTRRHWFCELGLIFAVVIYLAVSVLWLLHTPIFAEALVM